MAALSAVSKGNAGWLGPLGACEVLLEAYERHAEDKKVASAVWNAVGTLCFYNRERLYSLGAPQSVVSSLRAHFLCGVIQSSDRSDASRFASSAAFAIGRLCEPLHEGTVPASLSNRRALYSAGCCEVLTAVLGREDFDVAAASNTFRAIATLSNGNHCAEVCIHKSNSSYLFCISTDFLYMTTDSNSCQKSGIRVNLTQYQLTMTLTAHLIPPLIYTGTT